MNDTRTPSVTPQVSPLHETSSLQHLAARFTSAIAQVVLGHEANAKLLAGAFLIGGHVLLEGPPGIAKTLLAKTFAEVLGLRFRRIQFTPDLMPSDVTGVNVYDQRSGMFTFAPGPIFSDIILADEINRTPPKTQSALLEAMEERQVTIDGTLHELGRLFFVIATQNPIEHEGTFPLPEAQLDRFLFRLHLTYPSAAVEEEVVSSLSGKSSPLHSAAAAVGVKADELFDAQHRLRDIHLSGAIAKYIVALLHATREHPRVLLGASPRAGLHLGLAAKMHAAFEGRDFVIPDDVQAIVNPALNHRLILKPEAYSESPQHILEEIIRRVPVPSGNESSARRA